MFGAKIVLIVKGQMFAQIKLAIVEEVRGEKIERRGWKGEGRG